MTTENLSEHPDPATDNEGRYTIGEVTRLTGLGAERLRAWERRYEAVRPIRQPNGYRLYSAAQVALLRAYAKLIAVEGARISDLAALPRAEVIDRATQAAAGGDPVLDLLGLAESLDRVGLASRLDREIGRLGLAAFTKEIAWPFATLLGDRWATGKVPVGVEHMASDVVIPAYKQRLGRRCEAGPLVLGATMPGERHEWGILGALAIIEDRGFQVNYLGPDLPFQDAVDAAWKLRPAYLGLSVSDRDLLRSHAKAVRTLGKGLPPGTELVFGGLGAERSRRWLGGLGYGVGLEAVRGARA